MPALALPRLSPPPLKIPHVLLPTLVVPKATSIPHNPVLIFWRSAEFRRLRRTSPHGRIPAVSLQPFVKPELLYWAKLFHCSQCQYSQVRLQNSAFSIQHEEEKFVLCEVTQRSSFERKKVSGIVRIVEEDHLESGRGQSSPTHEVSHVLLSTLWVPIAASTPHNPLTFWRSVEFRKLGRRWARVRIPAASFSACCESCAAVLGKVGVLRNS